MKFIITKRKGSLKGEEILILTIISMFDMSSFLLHSYIKCKAPVISEQWSLAHVIWLQNGSGRLQY